jgi:hypothetical protein
MTDGATPAPASTATLLGRFAAVRHRPLWVLAIAGALGFRVGLVGFPIWQVAVESAQVVAGLVPYPDGNPFYIYHTKLWTLLHQVGAVALLAGTSEITLSRLLSGVMGMLGLQALAMVAYALSRDVVLSIGAAFVVFLSRTTDYGVVYPVMLMDTPHTYGVVGLSLVALVMGLFGSGCVRLGAFLLAIAPAAHPSLGAWLWLVVGLAIVWDVWALKSDLRTALPYFGAGCALTAVSLLVQVTVIADAPPIDSATASRYLSAFISQWDGHRRTVDPTSVGVALNVGALVVSGVRLWAREDLTRSATFALRMVIVAAVVGLSFVGISRIPPERLPGFLLVLMPSSVLNVDVLLFGVLIIGVMAPAEHRGVGRPAALVVLAALLFVDRSMFWDWAAAHPRTAALPRLRPQVVFASMTMIALALVLFEWTIGRRRSSNAAPSQRFEERLGIGLERTAILAMTVFAVWLAWRIERPWRSVFLDRTNDPIFAALASEPEGLVATAGSFQLVQLYSRRPVLLDGGGLDGLPYALEAGPAMERVLREVYGIDLFHPPALLRGGGVVPHEFNRGVWEAFSSEKWQQVRRDFDVRQVLTRGDWKLKLPIVAEDRRFRLFSIPPD